MTLITKQGLSTTEHVHSLDQPIRSYYKSKTRQELEFFALFNASYSIELMFRGHTIEYTVWERYTAVTGFSQGYFYIRILNFAVLMNLRISFEQAERRDFKRLLSTDHAVHN